MLREICVWHARRDYQSDWISDMYDDCTYPVLYTAYPGVIDGFGEYWARALKCKQYTLLGVHVRGVLDVQSLRIEGSFHCSLASFQYSDTFRSSALGHTTSVLIIKTSGSLWHSSSLLTTSLQHQPYTHTNPLQSNISSQPRVRLFIQILLLLTGERHCR